MMVKKKFIHLIYLFPNCAGYNNHKLWISSRELSETQIGVWLNLRPETFFFLLLLFFHFLTEPGTIIDRSLSYPSPVKGLQELPSQLAVVSTTGCVHNSNHLHDDPGSLLSHSKRSIRPFCLIDEPFISSGSSSCTALRYMLLPVPNIWVLL